MNTAPAAATRPASWRRSLEWDDDLPEAPRPFSEGWMRRFWSARRVNRWYLLGTTVLVSAALLAEAIQMQSHPRVTEVSSVGTLSGAWVVFILVAAAFAVLWWSAPAAYVTLAIAYLVSLTGQDFYILLVYGPLILGAAVATASVGFGLTAIAVTVTWVFWLPALLPPGAGDGDVPFGMVVVALTLNMAAAGVGLFVRIAGLRREDDLCRLEQATQAALDAAAAERRILARDLHDILAHNLTVISLQARTASFVGTEEAARQAIAVVGDTSRDALTDLRRMLHLLQEEGMVEAAGEPSAQDPAPTAGAGPLVDLELGLGRLAHQLEDFGFTVERRVDLRGLSLPLSTHGALYRVAQEATTNIIKHADQAEPVRIGLRPAGEAVVLEVSSGLAPSDRPRRSRVWNSSSLGLTTMRERVESFGGSLKAGPQAGRWVVKAVIPPATTDV